MTRERSEARVPSDRRSDIRDEGWIDRVVKVIVTHEALIRWAISQSEGSGGRGERQLEGEKVGERKEVTP